MTKSNNTHQCCSCSQDKNDSLLDNNQQQQDTENWRKEAIPLVIAGIIYILGLIFQEQLRNTPYHWAEYLVFIPVYLGSGWSVLSKAGKNIWQGQVFDENFLMTVTTLAAIAIDKLPEAVAVMVFYQIGEFCQELAVKRSRSEIKSLLAIKPDFANLQIDGELRQVKPSQVQVNNIIVVKPGEKIPLDGEIIDGSGEVNTSALTGESMPRLINRGENVLAGMLNQTGVLTIRVTKIERESAIARILTLVEEAKHKKSKTERFITQFARYYTPVVVFLSLAIAFIPPLLIAGANHTDWITRGLIVLVVSCPCAVVISIPLGYFGGIGGAAKRGILVKGSTFLDDLANVKTVVFDKTGTLTEGIFEVTEVIPHNGLDKSELLTLAGHIETMSNHPIAQAIVRQSKRLNLINGDAGQNLEDFQEIAGFGVTATFNKQIVLAGGDRLLHRENIAHSRCDVGGTAVHLAVDHKYAGYILIADQIKSDARQAIEQLQKLGVEKTVMLTGDHANTANLVGKQLGLNQVYAELLPGDKVNVLERIMQENIEGKVAFVGDGINDAPAIARADVGIAMGALGSDVAIETADVVLMTDAPTKVAEAIMMGRRTRRIVWQNIAFAMTVKGLFIILGIGGLASIWEAVFADVGVALLAVFNASRILQGDDLFKSINTAQTKV
jgi:Cd2+/Zn2+-exporting ATPase